MSAGIYRTYYFKGTGRRTRERLWHALPDGCGIVFCDGRFSSISRPCRSLPSDVLLRDICPCCLQHIVTILCDPEGEDERPDSQTLLAASIGSRLAKATVARG